MNVPSAATVALPNVLPAASLIATAEPASALPVTVTPSSLTTTSVGAAGAVVSGAVVVATEDGLPATSAAVTLSV